MTEKTVNRTIPPEVVTEFVRASKRVMDAVLDRMTPIETANLNVLLGRGHLPGVEFLITSQNKPATVVFALDPTGQQLALFQVGDAIAPSPEWIGLHGGPEVVQ
jgi:hypothetical protein